MGNYIKLMGPVLIVDETGAPVNLSGNVTNLGNITIVAGADVNPSISGNRTVGQDALTSSPTTLFAANTSELSRKVKNLDGNVTVYLNGNATTGYAVKPGEEYSELYSKDALTGQTSGNLTATVAIMGRDK